MAAAPVPAALRKDTIVTHCCAPETGVTYKCRKGDFLCLKLKQFSMLKTNIFKSFFKGIIVLGQGKFSVYM